VRAKRIVRRTASRSRGKTDWARVDAVSDREIEKSAKADPGAAPIPDKNSSGSARYFNAVRSYPQLMSKS
jgi:hypothetical protein